ncbi:MAG: penicillin-binding protein activator [Pseudomonadota bacterium]
MGKKLKLHHVNADGVSTRRISTSAFCVAAACASLLLAACATSLTPSSNTQIADTANTQLSPQANPAQQRRDRVRIALALPVGGISQTAIVAKSLKQAAEMALFERDDPNIQLIVKDDQGTSAGATAAAKAAIGEGAEIILGPLFAGAVRPAAQAAQQSQPAVPIVAFSNDRSVAGSGAYLISFMPEPEVHRIIDFASSQGKRRYVALIPDTPYGQIVERAFRAAVARNSGMILALEKYTPQSNDMIDPAQKVLDTIKQAEEIGAPVDAIFLPGGPNELPSIGPLISYANIDTTKVKLLGTGAWDFPNIGRDKVFVGGWYASPDPRGWRAFSERFAKTFGQAPPRIATLAYDAVNVAIELSNAPKGQRFTQARLTRPTGFKGVDGTIRFAADGTATRNLAILEVQRFGTTTIQSANGSLYGSGPAIETGSTPTPSFGAPRFQPQASRLTPVNDDKRPQAFAPQ